MRKPFCSMVVILALGSCFALAQQMPQQQGPSQNPQAQQTQGGAADIQSDIQSALQKEPSLAGASITVQVVGKSVELSGTVPNKDAKETAEKIAKDHSGGMDVKSRLKVAGTSSSK